MTQTRALSNRQIARATGVVVFGFVAGGILGLIRQTIIAATFGTSGALDAFVAAQRIPETIFTLVAGGALGSSFIPVFTRYLSKQDYDHAWRLASAVITLSSLAAAVLSALFALAAPWIVPDLLVPGKPPELQALTVSLTQIMMLTPFIFSISGLLMGILQTHQQFFLPALAVSMNSVGLIIGAWVLAPSAAFHFGGPSQVGDANVYGLAWGAVLSAVLHLAVQLPGLWQIRERRLRPLLNWRISGASEVLRLMGPRVLGLGVAQINFVVNTAFSSGMVEGSLVALNTGWYLLFFVLGVIGQSVGSAVYPSLTALVAEGNMQGYKERLAGALRSVLFLALPATIGLILLGRPVIAFLFQRRAWTPESTQAAAWALAFFAVGICGHAALEVLSRAFYALSDTRTPVVVGVASMVSNIVLSAVFIHFIGSPDSLERGAFGGLALANSLTTLLEAVALWALLRRRLGDLEDARVWDGIWRSLAAAVGMGLALFGLVAALDGFGPTVTSLVAAPLGLAVFLVLSIALGMEEPRSVLNAVLRRVRR
jgi:putative peptidoglycan lipid II flippase